VTPPGPDHRHAHREIEAAEAASAALGIDPDAPEAPRVGIVLGSGLGPFADGLEDARSVATTDLPHFPASTVAGHAGHLVTGRVSGVPVIVQKGRVHGYEGYPSRSITHALRVLARMGIRSLLLTNAAGAMRSDLRPGSLMLVRDHVNLSFQKLVDDVDARDLVPRERGGGRAAAGPGIDPEGSWIYSDRLAASAREAARHLGIRLEEGTLSFGRGPSYETPAEVRLYRKVGGDAACMSTVPEAVVARLLGLEVMAMSCISNLGTGLSATPLTHDEVTEIADQVSGTFRRLLTETVRRAFGREHT